MFSYPQAGCATLEYGFEESKLHESFRARHVTSTLESGLMSGWGARRPISDTAEILVPLAANATNWIPQSKILLLGTLSAFLMVVAIPILFGSPFAANSPLKCYDSAKNYEPCSMRATASAPPSDGGTIEPHRPPSWTTSALYQQEVWVTSAVEQPASWTTSAPVARRTNTPEKGRASATCGRRLIPCFFSALGRRLTHIASAAANLGRARPARERL